MTFVSEERQSSIRWNVPFFKKCEIIKEIRTLVMLIVIYFGPNSLKIKIFILK